MRLRIVAVLIAFATLGSAAAHAERAFTVADVNMRTGPDVEFPSVDVILEGETVNIEGCLRDESWCDVSWEGGRGWVFSEYLAVEDGGRMVALLDVGLVEFRIPYVTFVAADYWDRYYVGRPWYRDRSRWFSYRIRARSGWHAPPSGHRSPGWWRAGYHAPRGMRSPPTVWRRTERHDGVRRDAIRGNGDDRARHGRDRGDDGRSFGESRVDRGRKEVDDYRDGRRGRAAEGGDDRDGANKKPDNRNDGVRGYRSEDAPPRVKDHGGDRGQPGADRPNRLDGQRGRGAERGDFDRDRANRKSDNRNDGVRGYRSGDTTPRVKDDGGDRGQGGADRGKSGGEDRGQRRRGPS